MPNLKNLIRKVDDYQQRYHWLAFPYAVVKKYGEDEAANYGQLTSADGTRRTFGRRDERDLSRCVGCHLDRGEAVSATEGCGVLECAVWYVRKLGDNHTGGDLRYGGPVADYRGWP